MSNGNGTIVKLEDVTKVYALGKTEVVALDGVSFGITRGDFISIAGPSGSGKSTILNLIGCIDVPTTGSVAIQGQVTTGLGDGEITDLRHEVIGFIFQSFNLIPVLNVWENIEFPLLLGDARDARGSRKERKEWIDFLIQEVGLTQWKTHRPNELSGGQRQRVAIARALVTRPPLVLADEPTANLDSKTGEQIIMLMKKINGELETTFVFSTHDVKIIAAADHVIKLEDGRVIEDTRAAALHQAAGPRQAAVGATEAAAGAAEARG